MCDPPFVDAYCTPELLCTTGVYLCYHVNELCVHNVLHQSCCLMQRPASVSQSKPVTNNKQHRRTSRVNKLQVDPF